MAEITASMVKDLRERTGAGMMDCKNALLEAAGDLAKAVEVIQKKGLAKAVKAAGRIAADGMIVSALDREAAKGVLVEVNCQTDFVARGDEFKAFAKLVADQALSSGARDADALQNVSVGGRTLREHAEALTAKSGEKHAIRRLERFEGPAGRGVVTSYIHHGARLGVMVELDAEKGGRPEVRELADEIALQVASMGAKFVRKEDAPQELVAKQREIFDAQMKHEDAETISAYEEFGQRVQAEGGEQTDKVKEHLKALEKKASAAKARPEAAKAKILDGKTNKWLSEVTLLEQVSVKDSNKSIAQLLAEFSSKHGKAEVRRIARYEIGEGIDKGPVKDFATEVAEMTASAQKH